MEYQHGINWRRGLNRVFALITVAWVTYVLILYPASIARERQEAWVRTYRMAMDMPVGDREALLALSEAQKNTAGLWHVYEYYILPDIHLILGAAVIVPVITYSALFGLFRVGTWVKRGFFY